MSMFGHGHGPQDLQSRMYANEKEFQRKVEQGEQRQQIEDELAEAEDGAEDRKPSFFSRLWHRLRE